MCSQGEMYHPYLTCDGCGETFKRGRAHRRHLQFTGCKPPRTSMLVPGPASSTVECKPLAPPTALAPSAEPPVPMTDAAVPPPPFVPAPPERSSTLMPDAAARFEPSAAPIASTTNQGLHRHHRTLHPATRRDALKWVYRLTRASLHHSG